MSRFTLHMDAAGRVSRSTEGHEFVTIGGYSIETEKINSLRGALPENLPKWEKATILDVKEVSEYICKNAIYVTAVCIDENTEEWPLFWDDAEIYHQKLASASKMRTGFVKAANVIRYWLFNQCAAPLLAETIKKFSSPTILDFHGLNIVEANIVCDSDIQGKDNIDAFKACWEQFDKSQEKTKQLGIRIMLDDVKIMPEQDEPAALLLSKGVDVNSRDAYGSTPILIAAEYCSAALMKLFIENKAQTNLSNDAGNTILHNVSGCIYQPAENAKVLALLPSLDINANALNKSGQSAYGMAMDNMNIELVAVLRAKGVTERVGTTSSDNFNETLKRPSYFTPPSRYYYVPEAKEPTYQLAVEDCNSYTIPNKKGLLMVTGPVGWAVGAATDQVKVPQKFHACMKIMGFEPSNSKN